MAQEKKRRSRIKGQIQIEVILAFGFGVIFLITMLAFAVAFPNPAPFQIWVFITTLALAAGGIGAVLPGLIETQYKNVFRAGGALALVVMVYMFQPKLEESLVTLKEPPTRADVVAEAFLEDLDTGNIDAAWGLLDPAMIVETFPEGKEQFLELYKNTRATISGAVSSREVINRTAEKSPSGLPIGLYQVIGYRSRLADKDECFSEFVRLRATQDLEWRVHHYTVNMPAPC